MDKFGEILSDLTLTIQEVEQRLAVFTDSSITPPEASHAYLEANVVDEYTIDGIDGAVFSDTDRLAA